MRKSFLLSFCLAFLLAACGTAPVPRQIQNAFPIEAPFDTVWQGVIEVFADLNLPIQNMEKASGLITTDLIDFSSTKANYFDCGSQGFSLAQERTKGKFNVYVKTIDNSSVEIRINAIFEKTIFYDTGARTYPCISTGEFESSFFRLVSEKTK